MNSETQDKNIPGYSRGFLDWYFSIQSRREMRAASLPMRSNDRAKARRVFRRLFE